MDPFDDLMQNSGWADLWLREARPQLHSKLKVQLDRGLITPGEYVVRQMDHWNAEGRPKSAQQVAAEAML